MYTRFLLIICVLVNLNSSAYAESAKWEYLRNTSIGRLYIDANFIKYDEENTNRIIFVTKELYTNKYFLSGMRKDKPFTDLADKLTFYVWDTQNKQYLIFAQSMRDSMCRILWEPEKDLITSLPNESWCDVEEVNNPHFNAAMEFIRDNTGLIKKGEEE